MSRPIFYLSMEPYLKEWFINDCGGEVPVTLRKGSAESDIVISLVTEHPNNETYEPVLDDLPIFIPPSKMNDDLVHTFMSKRSKRALYNCIRTRFRQQLWKDMSTLMDVRNDAYGRQMQDILCAWMESHGISDSETNFLAVMKIYQRQRDIYRKKLARKQKKQQS